mgnify:FL=1
MIETTDLAKATLFYDAILQRLDIIRVVKNPDTVDYVPQAAPDAIEFSVTRPFDQQPLHHGNGVIIAFAALCLALVDQLHKIGMWNGDEDPGKARPWLSGGSVYYAYLRDADGNKICGFNDSSTA